ncbi:MAG TPA: riboflavin synthase [Gemmatimonadaceae bacterium]|nr:riboflavin synthase [Gemmatimonadaceae bacterium]
MFTGIVDAVGLVTDVKRTDAGLELTVKCDYTDLVEGESVSLNGVCLTVRHCGPGWFDVAAVVTTTGRTTIGSWTTGKRLNLERAMKADSRFGGHIVQGHVDAAARVTKVSRTADSMLIDIELPPGLSNTLVLHGSVTVDGVSLTVNDLDGDKLQVSIIHYTFHHTTLSGLEAGDEVQVETDVIGKYVQRLVAPYLNLRPAESRA